MRTLSYLVMAWGPGIIGLLMFLAGIANKNAHLIIVGLLSVGIAALAWLFMKNVWKMSDERRQKE